MASRAAFPVICVLAALLWRAPWFPFVDLNWDASLYRLVADALVRGHLPYEAVWDRKPAGLFVLVALVELALGRGAVPLYLAAAVAVGLGGWCLAGAARVLVPGLRMAGPLAALLWIVFSDRAGGMGMNAELFFVPLNLGGLWLLLRAGGTGAALMAGVLFGLAVQVKTNAAFDVAAFLLAWALFGAFRWHRLAVVATGAVLPTLAVLGWYGWAGGLRDWAVANLVSQRQALGGALPDAGEIVFALRRYDVPVMGAALALPWLARQGRLAVALGGWLLADVAALWVLGRLADHMTIQLLPVLCLIAACGIAALLAAAGRWRVAVAAVAGLAWLAWAGRDMARPFAAAAELMARRAAGEGAAWGDPSATAGALLAGRMAPGAGLYVFGGPILGVYEAAGRRPPTRFPFVEHLWGGYAPVDGVAELRRVLAGKPEYIAVEARWLAGGEVPPGAGAVFAVLHGALGRDYRREATVGPFASRGGGPIGPRVTIAIFRRVGTEESGRLTRLTTARAAP